MNSSEEILRKVRHPRNVPHYDMNTRFCQLLILISCMCAVNHWLEAQTPEAGKSTPEPSKPTVEPAKPKEFIYLQRLVPRLYEGEKWTRDDKAASDQHFARFLEATKSGQLILAGRTKEPGDKTFGIAIFEASDEAAARAFMKADPIVSAGLMTAELHPFTVALENTNPEPGNPTDFIYVLRLVPRLYDDTKWTKEDNAALDRHFIRFQEATKSGQLILAGRTKEPGDNTFGIAIFRARDEAAARKFMETDPAVVAKLMTAELHPFSVHLQRKKAQ
jgi:uncharacterized protein